MGKPKLMASIRALQQTLCNFKPTSSRSSSCLCVQQSQTHSFRFAADDIYKSFNSIYLDPRSAAKEKEEAGAGNGEEELDEGEEERESLLLLPLRARDSSSFDSSANPCSSSADSSSDSVLDLLLSGLSSKRFFFSPCTTKSILEEAKKIHNDGGGGDGGDGGGVLEPNSGEEELAFCNDSITMSMNSDDPYWDFRASMEEMVEAHGLRDWPCLQALLQCYLKLNDKKTHRIIVCAFIDLIINILDDARGVRPHESSSSSSSLII